MHKIPKLKWFSWSLAVAFAQSIEARCSVKNEDVVGAAPTGDATTTVGAAPTTSEWWTILLPTEVHLILEVWQYVRDFVSQNTIYVSVCKWKGSMQKLRGGALRIVELKYTSPTLQ